jgi:peptidoglycan/LPS O-acetylase OafA/YrhL
MITSHHLPGAFSDNVYNLSPNGSLLTLPIEFLCYIGCYMTYKLNLLDLKKAKPLFLLLVLVTLSQKIIASFLPITAEVLPLILLFSVGMLYYLYKDSIPLKPSIAFVCLILIIMSIFFNFYYITKILLLPYLIFYLSFGVKIKLPILDNLSKLAYGIYLWGFFVQQVVCYIFGGSMNPIINILISMPIAIVLSYLVTKFFDLRKKK